MRCFTIFCLVSLLFSCCKKANKEELIIGNWSVVNLNSTYHEVKIDSFDFNFYNYDTSFWPLRPYFFEGDSLQMFASESSKEYYTYYVDRLSENEFNLINAFAKMKLVRIDSSEFTFDRIRDFNKDQYKFEIAYLNRRNKILGIDEFYNYDSLVKIHEEMLRNIPETEQLVLPDYLKSSQNSVTLHE